MALGPDFCRDMSLAEEPEVDALLKAAFEGDAEVQLVHALRKAGQMVGEMVLPWDGGVIGYAGLVQMTAPQGWIALAPVAVDARHRNRGYGKRMVGLISEWARITRTPIVVVGQRNFYERAGFSHAQAQALSTPYGAENTLIAGIDGAPMEKLTYPKAFRDLG